MKSATESRSPAKKKPRKSLIARAFDRTFWVFFALAGAAGLLCWAIAGEATFLHGFTGDLSLMEYLLPRIVLAMFVAGLVEALLPKDKVAYWVGSESGMRGILIATAAGALTPGGPMTSFPFVVALYMAGADRGSLVAYLTSWSLLGFQRVMVWELPLLGPEFAALRLLANLPLPIIAGILARKFPGIEARMPGALGANPFGAAAHAPAASVNANVGAKAREAADGR
jgi:uncharacterized membrane protein YraQ (UPF0718 family)